MDSFYTIHYKLISQRQHYSVADYHEVRNYMSCVYYRLVYYCIVSSFLFGIGLLYKDRVSVQYVINLGETMKIAHTHPIYLAL